MVKRMLDIENIGRIGQMFIKGELLEEILIDPYTCDEDDTDYNIPAFNELKAVLMKIERMNPDLFVTGVLWCRYKANRRMAIPVIAGKAHPTVGWIISPCDESLQIALDEGINTRLELQDGRVTHYFPVRTTTDRIVGALGLTTGERMSPYEHRYDAIV